MVLTPSASNWKQRTLASFDRQTMMHTLGVTVIDIEPGALTLGIDRSDHITQQHGFVHGGALGAVLDSACGFAALTLMPEDHAVLTVEYKLNFLRPAEGDKFEGRGVVVKPGKTLTITEGTVFAADSPDRPIATMTATFIAVSDRDIAD